MHVRFKPVKKGDRVALSNHPAYVVTDLLFGVFQLLYNLCGTVKLFKLCNIRGKRVLVCHIQCPGNNQRTVTLNIQLAAVNIPKQIVWK